MSGSLPTDAALAFLDLAPTLHKRGPRFSVDTLRLWFRLTEIALVFLAAFGLSLPDTPGYSDIDPLWRLTVIALATVGALEVGRALKYRNTLLVCTARACAAAILGGCAMRAAGVAPGLSATWAGWEFVAVSLLLSGLGYGQARLFSTLLAAGRLAMHVAVVGSGRAGAAAVADLARSDKLVVQVGGRYASDEETAPAFRGGIGALLCDCRLEMIDAIVLALEPDQSAQLDAWRQALRPCIQDVYLLARAADVAPECAKPAKLGALDVVLLAHQPIRGASALAKRAFDVAAAALFLSVMAPLLLMLAAAIKLETRGPVLFRQLRVGYNNELFHILKFRSMYQDASDRLAKQQTVKGDKRVTKVGRIIRKLSLDELPQLFNVMRGDMSLVGPRPHAPGTSIGGQRVHTLVDDYACRHLVRPGITGLAQVRGLRGGLHDRRQVVERIASDLEYIRRWSLWLDIRILFGTILLELRDSRGS